MDPGRRTEKFEQVVSDGSLFNNMMSDLNRIASLCALMNEARVIDRLDVWQRAALSLEMELSPYFREDERKELEAVRVRNVVADRRAHSFERDRLLRYEMLLRRVAAARGFGMKSEESPANAALR